MKQFLAGKTRSSHIQFFRYLFVGGSSAVLDLTVYSIGTEFLHWHYLVANVAAFVVGLSWNYIFGLLWIFESKHSQWKEVIMVFAIAIGGLLWTQLLLYLFIEYASIHHFIAKIIATWIVLFWNFAMRKFYVFH